MVLLIIGFAIFVIYNLFFKSKEANSPKSGSSSHSHFPNRCYSCEHYADALGPGSLMPTSSRDSVNCPVGGTVRVQSGCGRYKPDITADCLHCWNMDRSNATGGALGHCTIHGKIQIGRSRCPDHIYRDG